LNPAFLKDNPNASLDIHPHLHEEKEKEFIVIYEAKKQYYRQKKTNKNFTIDDSLQVEKMDNKHPGFLDYMNKRITDPLLFTIQHKSLNVVGTEKVNGQYAFMNTTRKKHFISYFPEDQHKRLTFHPIKSEVPFNAQSLYEISYKGEVPEKLKEEYRRYQNLNDDFIRGNFKTKRKLREVFF